MWEHFDHTGHATTSTKDTSHPQCYFYGISGYQYDWTTGPSAKGATVVGVRSTY